ncbi:hypothetical protein EAE96_008546 [Botrytis aclada]|nr:hypothetical protein EAE96_008546 [Botrytis aclada]
MQPEKDMAEWRALRQQMLEGHIQHRMPKNILEIMDREFGIRATEMLKGICCTESLEREDAETFKLMNIRRVHTSCKDEDLLERDPDTYFLSQKPGYTRSIIWEPSKDLEISIKGNSVNLLNTLPSLGSYTCCHET